MSITDALTDALAAVAVLAVSIAVLAGLTRWIATDGGPHSTPRSRDPNRDWHPDLPVRPYTG